ncbi:MAG: hypothetical protein U0V74_10930 [Chitinophagales bacterium]
MNKLLAAALLFAFSALNAQENILFKAYVFDKDTKQPLELAAAHIKGTQLGGVTDNYGYVEVPMPKVNLKDSILFTYIGYEPQGILVPNYDSKDTVRVYLSSGSVVTKEAVITALNAKGVLIKAIDNMKANLLTDSTIATGFYRQYHEENGKYVRLLEADVNVAFNTKSIYQYSFHESLKVNKERRSENYETNGDVHGDHLVDLLKENPYSYNKNNFLDKKKLDFYSPKFVEENNIEYVISVQYKEASSAKLENAKLWITKENYAITKIEVEKFPNPYYVKTRYANDSRWKLVNETDVIRTEQVNGKYVVSSIERTYNHHVINKVTGNVDYVVQESFELYFYNYDTENVSAKLKNGYAAFSDLYTTKYKYDSKFWGSYEPVSDYELDEDITKDLEHAKKLEDQYIEAGK